jgi:hypothetical protein
MKWKIGKLSDIYQITYIILGIILIELTEKIWYLGFTHTHTHTHTLPCTNTTAVCYLNLDGQPHCFAWKSRSLALEKDNGILMDPIPEKHIPQRVWVLAFHEDESQARWPCAPLRKQLWALGIEQKEMDLLLNPSSLNWWGRREESRYFLSD